MNPQDDTSSAWRYIPHYPDYAVSDLGDVANIKRSRYLNYIEDDRGYARVTLYNRDGSRKFYVHRLVAQAFLKGYDDDIKVEHRNGVNYDNRAENLRLIMPKPTRLRIDDPDYLESKYVRVVETGEIYRNAYACAHALNTHPSNIYKVLNGRAKSHRGLTFEYYNRQVIM